jgi:hypothetical protein
MLLAFLFGFFRGLWHGAILVGMLWVFALSALHWVLPKEARQMTRPIAQLYGRVAELEHSPADTPQDALRLQIEVLDTKQKIATKEALLREALAAEPGRSQRRIHAERVLLVAAVTLVLLLAGWFGLEEGSLARPPRRSPKPQT